MVVGMCFATLALGFVSSFLADVNSNVDRSLAVSRILEIVSRRVALQARSTRRRRRLCSFNVASEPLWTRKACERSRRVALPSPRTLAAAARSPSRIVFAREFRPLQVNRPKACTTGKASAEGELTALRATRRDSKLRASLEHLFPLCFPPSAARGAREVAVAAVATAPSRARGA